MHRLLLDLGNSRLKWALEDEGRFIKQGALAYRNIRTWALPTPKTPHVLESFGVAVAKPELLAKVQAHLTALGVSPMTVLKSERVFGELRNGYDHPERLGADRWAALVGTWCTRRAPTLVVCAGTATTVDFLDTDEQGGVFRGGVILPGLSLMRQALARGTARLPDVQTQHSHTLWPTQTEDAIAGGCLQAQTGAIERLFAQIPTEKKAVCWLAGGAAPELVKALRIPFALRPDLVLEGAGQLARAYGLNDCNRP